MSTKGKGKGKKKGKDKKVADPNKLTQVDRQFCELTITDLNHKLARLRSHLANLDDTNVTLTDQLRGLEEDRVDVAAHLERTLNERNDEIQELEQKLTEITKVRDEENEIAQEAIQHLESKYKAMHDQLTSEIKLLNGKLNSLDEFRVQRDILLAKFEDQQEMCTKNDRKYKDTLYDIKQDQVVERVMLKKETEEKLLDLSQDFTRSNEIRNAGYARRLIRENIALQEEIDNLVESQMKIQQKLEGQEERQREMVEQCRILRELRDQLICNTRNKILIIEKLTTQYESIKPRYIEALKYRDLYERQITHDVCERFTVKDLKKKLRLLGETVEVLKMEKKKFAAQHTSHEMEILRLRKIIDSMKYTLHEALIETKSEKQDSDDATDISQADSVWQLVKRRNLLGELVNILAEHTSQFAETPSASTISEAMTPMYRKGRLGFIHSPDSTLFDVFTQDRHVEDSETESYYVARHEENKLVPKARATQSIIVDAVMGDPLYVSSSHEDLVVVQVEEEPLEAQEATSSDAQSTAEPSIASVTDVHGSISRASKSSKSTNTKDPSVPSGSEQVEEEFDFLEYFY